MYGSAEPPKRECRRRQSAHSHSSYKSTDLFAIVHQWICHGPRAAPLVHTCRIITGRRADERRLSDPHIIITTRQRRPWGHTFVRGSRHTGQHAPCSVAPAHRLTPDGAVRAVVQERSVRRHTTLQRPYRYLSSAAELSAAGEGARIGGSPIAKCRPPQPRCTSPCSCEQRRLCG